MLDNNVKTDSCPSWANEMILQLRALEVKLNNIPDSPNWSNFESIEALYKKINERDQHLNNEIFLDEGMTEKMFATISKKLSAEGFSVEDIVSFINKRIGYKGGPAYCNAAEVIESINS